MIAAWLFALAALMSAVAGWFAYRNLSLTLDVRASLTGRRKRAQDVSAEGAVEPTRGAGEAPAHSTSGGAVDGLG